MTLLLAALCIVGQVTVEGKQACTSVRVFVISQQKFKNRGHHPWNNRRVIFRLVNGCSEPLIVYGAKFDDGFEPTGYIISFNPRTGEWEYPNPSNSPTP